VLLHQKTKLKLLKYSGHSQQQSSNKGVGVNKGMLVHWLGSWNREGYGRVFHFMLFSWSRSPIHILAWIQQDNQIHVQHLDSPAGFFGTADALEILSSFHLAKA